MEEYLGEWLAWRATPAANRSAIKTDTLDNYLSALRSVHVNRRLDTEVFASPWIKRILAGIRRTEPVHSTKHAFPISHDVLEAITSRYPGDIETSQIARDNLNFDTLAKVAFAGFFRLGELTFKSHEQSHDFTDIKIRRNDVTFASDGSQVQIRLRRSKTDKENRGVNIVLAATSSPTCPVRSLRALFIADRRPPSAPLFNVGNEPMQRNWFIRLLKKRLTEFGYSASGYNGHSFRRGAAQQASDNGLTNDDIMLLGRWSSDAFKRYFETSLINRYEVHRRFQGSLITPHTDITSLDPSTYGAASLYGGSRADN